MNATDWLSAYADKLGIDPPTRDDVATLLDLAAEAAHASHRIAAPIACWLAARADLSPDEALALARTVVAES